MKLLRAAVLVLAVAFFAQQAKAQTFTDSTGDTAVGPGILDISSVEVSSGPSDVIFKINLVGDPIATDWGKYMVGIHTGGGGDTAGNGWGRPIELTLGMNYWLGSWVDSGNGLQVFAYSGSWSQTYGVGTFAGGSPLAGLAITKDASSVTFTVPLLALGLSVGSVVDFDVYTSGGGGTDSAIDSLANGSTTVSDWGGPPTPYSSSLHKTFTVVPEPSTLVLVGLGGLIAIGGLFRRRA